VTTLGLHWFLEGRGSDATRLGDEARFEAVLRELPEALGLTVLTPPQIQEHDGGMVGMVLLAESHFTLRSSEGGLHADLFSCRAVDFTQARERLQAEFGPMDVTESTVERAFDD
jgi:S-adenosylmethionine/arginine decarboxylase-like enzyme